MVFFFWYLFLLSWLLKLFGEVWTADERFGIGIIEFYLLEGFGKSGKIFSVKGGSKRLFLGLKSNSFTVKLVQIV